MEDHDAATDDDSITDGRTQLSEVTASIATNFGIPSHLEEVRNPIAIMKTNIVDVHKKFPFFNKVEFYGNSGSVTIKERLIQ